MLDAVTAPDTPDNYGLLRVALRWNQDTHRPPDDLLSRVAEQSLRALVPTCDDTIEVLAYYCVITELDNGSEPHALKEGVCVCLPNDFLQSRGVIRSFA